MTTRHCSLLIFGSSTINLRQDVSDLRTELHLLVLLAILQLLKLPWRNHLRRFDPLSRFPHKPRESQRQLLDSLRLPPFDRFRRNQLAADTNR